MINRARLLLISDDDKNILYNKMTDFIGDDESIVIDYSESNFESFKGYMRRNYYIIYIDYDNLNKDVNELIEDIYRYLLSLPFIFVLSSDANMTSDSKLAFYINLNSLKKETFKERLHNIIRILKYYRQVKAISFMPGNDIINDVIVSKFKANMDFTVSYIDIDNFKAVSDYYGFFRTNNILKFLSNTIRNNVEKYGTPKDFMGNPGGDDYVVIFDDKNISKIVCDKIIEDFDAGISDFYDEKDLKNGYISTLNREGELEKFPISTLSIISITKESDNYSSPDEIFKVMMERKHEAKQFSGSILLEAN